MDKRCNGCIHRGYLDEKYGGTKEWGFCTHPEEQVDKDHSPCCLVVQTKYEGECPHRKIKE